VTRATRVDWFPPGTGVTTPVPGDFILVRGTHWISRAVRLLQWLRRAPAGRPALADGWSHAALVTGSRGRIVEVVYGRPYASHIGKYRDLGYHYVRVDASRQQRLAAVRFAEARAARPRVWPLHHCSSLVAQALAAGGAEFPRAPRRMHPGDLGWHYGARGRTGARRPSRGPAPALPTLSEDTTPR
jgi:hypothetical protein